VPETTRTLIIGASTEGGIGEAIAHTLQGNGFQPVCPSIHEADVTSAGRLAEYVSDNGPFPYAIYCAGIQRLGWIKDLNPEDVIDVFDVNVLGYINLLNALVKHQPGGRVVAITSLSARIPMRGSIAYCASKAALNHAVRCAARELTPDWHITGVMPTTVDETPLTTANDKQIMAMRGWSAEEAAAREAQWIPIGRRARKDEVADVVLDLLLGPEMLTGSIVEIAGGG
jgi:NAD(P)-dependent dehydrogenase (short-subunit alcohol dehydrogenase family)